MMIKLSHIAMVTAGLALALTAIPFAGQAIAQGTVGPTPAIGYRGCPSGYKVGGGSSETSDKTCYPLGSSAPAVYPNPNGKPCAAGYRKDGKWCTDKPESAISYKDPTFGNLTKADEYDRCPVGYHTSDSARTTCVSYHQDKSPKSRLKKGAACGADEVDEWGLWCTSKTTTLTRAQAEDEAISDVNIIFAPAGRGATQGADYENTPGLVGIFGRKGGGASAASGSSSGDGQTAQASGCASRSATGAAIGGAVAGEGGAVLGSMLGGLGKKKKKGGC